MIEKVRIDPEELPVQSCPFDKDADGDSLENRRGIEFKGDIYVW
jgi:hypothetical protein